MVATTTTFFCGGCHNHHKRCGTPRHRRPAVIRGGVLGGGLASAARLLENPRFEVFPADGVADAVAEWVPPGMTVTVTASPAKGMDATLAETERLAALGYHVVPHVSARLVRDDAHLAGIVARLLQSGVDDVFVPAG